MSIIDDALHANATRTDVFDPALGAPPAPRIAIVTCADPRLSGKGKKAVATDINAMTAGYVSADLIVWRASRSRSMYSASWSSAWSSCPVSSDERRMPR